MRQKYVAVLGSSEQRMLKRGRCPWCGGSVYDGTLDESVGHGDICYDCKVVFTGPLTIED